MMVSHGHLVCFITIVSSSVLAFWSVDIKDCLTFDEYWVRKELEDMIRYEVLIIEIYCRPVV